MARSADLLDRLAEDPAHTALFIDVDGVLAPIVPRPDDARVPDETRAELHRLAGGYGRVACITGRSSDSARRIVGVPELTYVGNHGLELEPAAAEWTAALQRLLADVAWPYTEDKGLSAALHYRGVPDEAIARAQLEAVADRARERGFVARFGRKVLDLVPPLDADKGTAVRALLERDGFDRALAAGDDTTDLDAFRALDGLALAVRIAVSSDEGPAQLREQADLVVPDPAAFLAVLRRL